MADVDSCQFQPANAIWPWREFSRKDIDAVAPIQHQHIVRNVSLEQFVNDEPEDIG